MQTPHLLYRETVSSDLGEFELRIESTNRLLHIESKGLSVKLLSTGCQIIIKRIAAPVDSLPSHMHVDRAEAWLFYVTKLGAELEQLNLSFCLVSNHSKVDAGADTGQGLVAIEFEDGTRQVHIGTQDEETFDWYSQQAWVPKRISQELANGSLLITTIVNDGLKTQIPALLENEQFYLHYVWAESQQRNSVDYPEEQDISTWCAVDQPKEALEKAWERRAFDE